MITAKVLAHSISPSGKEIVTFELEYPRFIHAEFMTHRLFSRNCASSRAIPTKKIIAHIQEHTARPVVWGKNQAGMQAREEHFATIDGHSANDFWDQARDSAIVFAEKLNEAGYHKQIVNRLIEPFQLIKTVMTATELANFFHLRDHPDAQPEIALLARKMREALAASTPTLRKRDSVDPVNEYHLPYVSPVERLSHPIEDLIKISTARCAAVSYRNEDYPLGKCREVYDRLVGGNPKHSSALEHVARVISDPKGREEGVSHFDLEGFSWSGNFKGWIQHRKLIEGECVW